MIKDINSPICFFDSGIGGLSVYSKFRQLLPHENTVYYGDFKNLPYGDKTTDELELFARRILDFFKTKNAKAVVIACNTSSALVYDRIKNDYYFKIYPIIQSCARVISEFKIKKIGVFATAGTVNSHAYSKEICKYSPNITVKEIACPNWVNFVENNEINTEKCYDDVKKCMKEMIEFQPEKIILGCTHYPCLLNTLNKFVNEDVFIDPSFIFANYVKEDLVLNHLINKDGTGLEEFFVSAFPQQFLQNANIFYSIKNIPSVV